MKTTILKNDIYDKPVTFIAITAPRPIYQQRLDVMLWFVVILISLATIFTLAVLWIVDRMVLKRVLRLNWTVHKIQHTGDLQTRVVLPGKDELSDLTSSINGMLESLFKAKQRDEVANTKLLQASRMASVGSLISGFAHELNNPLMVMQGNLMLLNQSLSPVLPENSEARVFMKNQNDALCRIVTAIKRLRTVIQPVTNVVTPLNVHDVIEQSIQIIEHSYQLEGIDVVRAFYAPVTTILCNANKFQQMLLCFLSNSYKALANRDNKRITIYTELEDHQLVLKVIDNGCGIETEKLSSLLDPHALVEHVAAGDCMGLSIAYDTVQELSGAISCSSQLHEGTIFTVRIPLPIAKAA
jgi:two-component system C4-dicarboxylate transport sensor histidine kinase DctB